MVGAEDPLPVVEELLEVGGGAGGVPCPAPKVGEVVAGGQGVGVAAIEERLAVVLKVAAAEAADRVRRGLA